MSELINHDSMDFIAEMLDSSDQKDLKREHEEQSTDVATAHTVVHYLRTRDLVVDRSSTRSTATTAAAATSTSSSSVSGSGASATAVTVPKAKGSAKAATKSASTAKKTGGVHCGPQKIYEPMIEVAKSMMPNSAGSWLQPYTEKCKVPCLLSHTAATSVQNLSLR